MNNLVIRILSAIVLISIIVGLYMWRQETGLFSFVIVFLGFAIFEINALIKKVVEVPKRVSVGFVFLAGLLLSTLAIEKTLLLESFSVALVGFITHSIWATRSKIKIETLLQIIALYCLGFIYCLLLPSFVISLLLNFEHINWFLFLCLIVPSTDIFAYFGGSLFGKHKMMPDISPKKSLEGLFSGVIGAVIVALVFNYYVLGVENNLIIGLLAVITSYLAQTGDLLESLLKRVAQVKDSGKTIPGHGGVLDRIDGFLLAGPIVYIFARYISFISV